MHEVIPRYPRSTIWLNDIPKEGAIESFNLIAAGKSTYDQEALKYGKTGKQLQRLCTVTLGLRLLSVQKKWRSRVPESFVREAHRLAVAGERTVAASAVLVKVSERSLGSLFHRLSLPTISKAREMLHPTSSPGSMVAPVQESSTVTPVG